MSPCGVECISAYAIFQLEFVGCRPMNKADSRRTLGTLGSLITFRLKSCSKLTWRIRKGSHY